MPAVIRNVGRAKTARLHNGQEVERAEWLQLKDGKYPTLSGDIHFVYKTKNLGSSMMCTCGGEAVVVGYAQYKQYSSYIGNDVIMCLNYAQYGEHRDRSH